MLCVFVEIEPGVWKCEKCAQPNVKNLDNRIFRECEKQLTFAEKVANFTVAVTRYAASGFRMRTAKNVAKIYNEVCKPCEFFLPVVGAEEGSCQLCGCRLTPKRETFNKIAWRSECCPHPDGPKFRSTDKNTKQGCKGCLKNRS